MSTDSKCDNLHAKIKIGEALTSLTKIPQMPVTMDCIPSFFTTISQIGNTPMALVHSLLSMIPLSSVRHLGIVHVKEGAI